MIIRRGTVGMLREAGPQVQQQSVCKRVDASVGLKVPRRIFILLAYRSVAQSLALLG